MSEHRYASFEEFWPFYVAEHSKSLNRTLHFIGTSLAVSTAALGLVTGQKKLLMLAPVLGYGPAWVGHFFIEKNRPATFQYPLWSLLADFKMWSLIARGEMQAEVDRVLAEKAAIEAATRAAENATATNGAHASNGVRIEA